MHRPTSPTQARLVVRHPTYSAGRAAVDHYTPWRRGRQAHRDSAEGHGASAESPAGFLEGSALRTAYPSGTGPKRKQLSRHGLPAPRQRAYVWCVSPLVLRQALVFGCHRWLVQRCQWVTEDSTRVLDYDRALAIAFLAACFWGFEHETRAAHRPNALWHSCPMIPRSLREARYRPLWLRAWRIMV